MYYILYEGLKIDSNESVYCTAYVAVSSRGLNKLKRIRQV